MKAYLRILAMYVLLPMTLLTSCEDEDIVKDVEIPEPTSTSGLVAVAGADVASKVDETIALDGSLSNDKNGKPFTYSWSVLAKPSGASVQFSASTSAKTTATASKAGVYVIQLMIKQGNWSAKDDLMLTVTEDPGTVVAVILNEDMHQPRTLEDIFPGTAEPDYIVSSDLKVYADLTINPGVVVAFQEDKSLQIVHGSIQAVGTSGNGIVLRGLVEESGYWRGIVIHTNSTRNEFDNVTVSHGGRSVFIETNTRSNLTLAGFDVTGAALKIKNSTLSMSGSLGLHVQGSSTIADGGNNSLIDNDGAAAFFPASQLHKLNTSMTINGNGENAIETSGAVWFEEEQKWSVFNGTYYKVTGDIDIRSGLIIEPGVTLKVAQGFWINVIEGGYLHAIGTESLPITFTSTSANANWNGLYINTMNEKNKLSFCEISNGGKIKFDGAQHPANVVIGANGKLLVANSTLKNSPGYGLLTIFVDRVNEDVATINDFANVVSGHVFPKRLNYPDWPEVKGVWLDWYSFNNGSTGIANNFYEDGTWFGGADRPWDMENAGFGIEILENGYFTWTIAEHSPMTGCASFSAEYITGDAGITETMISFNQDFWQSKFVNPCDESQNVDIGVEPQRIDLPYEINKMYNVVTGEEYWEIKFRNPDNSTFAFYRR